jgi:RNA polymerase sigma-70 factor (ECF subfamily)
MFQRITRFRREPSDGGEAGPLCACGVRPGNRGGSRDQATLTLLLQRHRDAVVHFLYRMVQDRTVAEELAAEVFLRVCRSTGRWSSPAALPATSLFRMAADLALKELSNGKGLALPAPPVDVFEETRRGVAAMPAKQRAAVLMHKYHRMDSGQIARVLDCSEPKARSLLLSAYDQLRGRVAACGVAPDWDAVVTGTD